MNTKHLYKLPWTASDNPNGWLEPTTYCNLKCPGCYRGCDQKQHKPVHIPLADLRQQVDWMLQNRNIQTLSIAGGEPLLYPQLDELISYAAHFGLRIMVYTNGILLDKERYKQLSELGVSQFLIHIDEFQQRQNINSFEDAIKARENFCQTFRPIPGANLGFIQPLYTESLPNLKKLLEFFTKNRDGINLVVFTLYREINWEHDQKPGLNTQQSMNEAIELLKQAKFMQPASYLPATLNFQEPAWVFSYQIGSANKVYGSLPASVYAKIQERYRIRKARYLFISKSSRVKRLGLLKLLPTGGIAALVIKSVFSTKPLYLQTSLLIRGPIKAAGNWDLCEGCPDAMLFEGKLVPSCILEDLRKSLPVSL